MAGSNARAEIPKYSDFKHWLKDDLRYSDTDRQGHVNNAVFVTYLESGRVDLFYKQGSSLLPEGANFVLAHLELDYLGEIRWPNEVTTGTSIKKIGTASFTLFQGIFVNEICVAVATSVVVLVDASSRKPKPLPEETKARLKQWMGPA